MRSLRSRLFAAIVGTVLIAAAASLAIGIATTRHAIRNSIADEVSRQADALASRPQLLPARGTAGGPAAGLPPGAEPPLQGVPGAPPEAAGPGPQGRDAPRIVTLAVAGQVLPDGALSDLRSSGSADGTATINGEREIYAARSLGNGRVLILLRPDDLTSSDSSGAVAGLLLAAALGLILAAIAAALLSPRLAAPMRRAAAAARELAAGEHPEELPEEPTNEGAELVGAINDLAEQLTTARAAERAVLLSVSHELRTPLTTIRGYAEGIQDQAVPVDEAAAVIESESVRLERLVQDLLALARIEQGVLEVRSEPVDLAAIAAEAQRRLALQAGRAKVEVEVAASGTAGAGAIGDHDRVLQVVSNLVENAIRVTPEGGKVRIGVEPASIEVADTGPGIPADDLERAFERFHLRSRHGRGSADGGGVGLAIVRELTEAMGGKVSVASEPGEGAHFTIELPAAQPGASASPREEP